MKPHFHAIYAGQEVQVAIDPILQQVVCWIVIQHKHFNYVLEADYNHCSYAPLQRSRRITLRRSYALLQRSRRITIRRKRITVRRGFCRAEIRFSRPKTGFLNPSGKC